MAVLKNYLGSSYDQTAKAAGYANAEVARQAGHSFQDVMTAAPVAPVATNPAPTTPATSPITTSAPVTSDLNNLDAEVAKLGLEQPGGNQDQALADLTKQKNDLLEQQYKTKENDLRAQAQQRIGVQGQANAQILGESRAALAGLGILSTEPGMVSATPAQQYLDGVKIQNQKEMDNILAEENSLLNAAKDAKDAGQLQVAQDAYDEAKKLREERNNLRITAAQESRAIAQAQREGRAADVDLMIKKATEDRAAKNFSSGKAQDAVAILEKTNFRDFASYSPSEINQIELAIGLPEGSLKNYAQEAVAMKTIAGYESSIQSNPTTGEVTVIYYRKNPDTGQIQSETKSLGFIGDRFSPTSKTEKADVGGYDISSYASDPNHENGVQTILNNIGTLNSLQDVQNYITKTAPNSPITADMISKTSEKYGISWEMLLAMMQQDSSLGTAGKAVFTMNPGNVGTYGDNVGKYNSWQAGVDAVGAWLGNHRVNPTNDNEKELTNEQKVNQYFNSVQGEDYKVSPDDWKLAKEAWIADNGTASEFDKKFIDFQNPEETYN